MSFVKNLFGGGKKTVKKEQNSTSSNTNNSGSNYSKCKGMAFPYVDSSESELRVENIGLFDGNKLLLDKLEEQFENKIKEYSPDMHEDFYRPPEANKYGGIEFNNKEITSLIRSAGTDIIKQVGKKIISGDFNLTTISFPIRVMIPLTILQSVARSFFQFPYYMNLAHNKDDIEKLKYTIVASLSSFFCSSFFLKPLNPVLGETYEGLFSDGSKFYLEQTSHHPPVSHYEVYGPKNKWYYSGYSAYSSSAGLNSCGVINKGKRSMKFSDGTKFEFDFVKELFSNSFWGVLKLESYGEMTYIEKNKGIECKLKIGGIKNKPSDEIYGEITQNGVKVCTVTGSYLSHISFDGKKYWDIRENFPISVIELDKNLPSSSVYREDRKLLDEEKLEEAQIAKEKIENLQRKDRKLRQEYNKK